MSKAYFYVNGKQIPVELPKPQPIQERVGWFEFVENLPTWTLLVVIAAVLVAWTVWKVMM